MCDERHGGLFEYKYPSPFERFVEFVGIIAGVCASWGYFPDKEHKEHDTSDR